MWTWWTIADRGGPKTADDFRTELARVFDAAADVGRGTVVVRSGDLHRLVGGYPGTRHRMPVCCNVMYADMVDGVDEVLAAPPKARERRWRSNTCCRAPVAVRGQGCRGRVSGARGHGGGVGRG